VSFWQRFLSIISGPLMLPRAKEARQEIPPEIPNLSAIQGSNQTESNHLQNGGNGAGIIPPSDRSPIAAEVSSSQLPPGMITMFELLTEGISTISYELHHVREAIEKIGDTLSNGASSPKNGTPDNHPLEVIRLDIDSFLAKHETPPKE